MKQRFKLRNELLHLEDQFVLGTIGGIRGIRKSDATIEEIIQSVDQQATQLLREIQMGYY